MLKDWANTFFLVSASAAMSIVEILTDDTFVKLIGVIATMSAITLAWVTIRHKLYITAVAKKELEK